YVLASRLAAFLSMVGMIDTFTPLRYNEIAILFMIQALRVSVFCYDSSRLTYVQCSLLMIKATGFFVATA
ncbi:hypothetical protein, partial [Limosilactobacillus panis]